MSFRTTYILFGILGAVVLVFGLALWLAPVTPPNTKYVFPSVHDNRTKASSEDVVRVEVQRPGADEPIVFTREAADKPFVMVQPARYRINESLVHTLVSQVLNAQKVESADLTSNLAQWGLKDPKGKVVLKLKDGRELTMNLGDYTDDRLYVTSSDQPKTPLALARADVDTIFNGVNDFRTHDLITLSSGDIHYLRVEGQKKGPVILEASGTNWKFVKPDYGPADPEGVAGGLGPDASRNPTGVRTLLTALTDIRVEGKGEEPAAGAKKEKKEAKKDTGFVADKVSDADLEKYGLKSEATASLVIGVKKEPSSKTGEVLLIGKKAGDKGDLYYARLEGNNNVVTVSGKKLEPLRKFLAHPEEVRDHNLVRLSDKPDVIRIKRSGDEGVELVRKPSASPPRGGFHGVQNDSWKVYLGSDKKGMVADPKAVEDLTRLLLGQRQVREFPTGKPEELGLAHPEATVSLWINGIKPEKKEEKKEGKKDEAKKDKKKEEPKKEETRPQLRSETPDVVLEFGRPRDGLVAVRRKIGKDLKDVSIVKVPEDIFKQVDRSPLAYLEKILPPLVSVSSSDLRKITLDLNGKVTEVARKDASSPWLYDKPSDLKGRKADKDLVQTLFDTAINNVPIRGWQALKPKDSQLTDWGLKPPLSKATVSYVKDGKTQEKSLLIGKETPDKEGYYARQSDSERVFTIAKGEIERLRQPLLDLTVFDFTASQAKKIKLTIKPKPLRVGTLELERKSAKEWTAAKPAGIKINAGRAEDLVKALEHLKAEKFVDAKGAYDLEVKQGALEIEITLDNKAKEKLTLTIGKAEGGSFYAASNKQPGTVFLIGKGQDNILENVKKDLAYLVAE